jgi:hypothetical protein
VPRWRSGYGFRGGKKRRPATPATVWSTRAVATRARRPFRKRSIIAIHCIIALTCYSRISGSEGARIWRQIIWNEEPEGNVQHIEEHGLTVDDVEHVLANPTSEGVSRSSGLPCVFGYTPDDTHIIVVYEQVDEDTIYPVTAYEVPEP